MKSRTRLRRPTDCRRMLASCVPGAAAQLTVFDPANYQENLLSAARALEQINNQVRQLQGQVLMLQRMDQNLRAARGHDRAGSAAHARRHPDPAPGRRRHRAAPAGDPKRVRAVVPETALDRTLWR